MTIFQFESLPLPDKLTIVWQHGKLIRDKKSINNIISTYSLFSFHVEIYCDNDFTTIEDITAKNFKRNAQLIS